ncbi:MAG: hypothetical protein IJH75_05355 [Mogibacterium sp.]|nr:hypothetical protein [Mogibacterium sp.]
MKAIFNKFNLTINIYISLIINIVLSIVLPLKSVGMLNPAIFFKGFIIAFPVSTIFVLLVPLNKLGDKIAGAFGLKPNSAGFKLVSTAVLALILGTLMCMMMVAIMAGVGPWYWDAVKGVYPTVLISVYLSALVGVFTAFPVAVKLCGPPPGMPPQE